MFILNDNPYKMLYTVYSLQAYIGMHKTVTFILTVFNMLRAM